MIHTPSSARIERFRFVSFEAETTAAAPVPASVSSPQKPVEPLDADVAALMQMIAPQSEAAVQLSPSFSEFEMEEARLSAYQQGLSKGAEEAEAKAKAEAEGALATHNNLLEVIANRVTLAAESHTHYLQSQQEIMTKTVLTVARKVAGDALKREPQAPVESLLRECIGLMAGSPEVVVTVAATKLDGLRQSMDMLQRHLMDFKGKLSLEADETLGEHDCRVSWKNGQAQRDLNALWNDIESLVKRATLTN